MKKLVLCLLLLAIVTACKKKATTSDPVPTETICLIQKITYDDGNYEGYKFDANNRLIETTFTYEDNGKIIPIPVKHEYNAAGNLVKSSTPDGWTDNYVYDASGLLTRVDFKDEKGQIDEQFTVTMDSQKRITKIVSKKYESTGTYEYNGPNGVFSKSEVRWEGKIIDQYIVNSYEQDKTKKSYSIAIKGHPFHPGVFTDQIIYGDPLNFQPTNWLGVTGKSSTQYDVNWNEVTDKLRIYSDFSATRKFNSNNFVTERTSNDIVSKSSAVKKFSYSNCN